MWYWLALLGISTAVGISLVWFMVAPARWQALALLFVVVSGALTVLSIGPALREIPVAQGIGLAAILCATGVSAGYWLAASRLPLMGRHQPAPASVVADSVLPALRPVVVLSCAEPERYAIASVAARLRRLAATGALDMPASALPFVFLAERARYRAIGSYNPARATARDVADQMESRLAPLGVGPVTVAWCDGQPSLWEVFAGFDTRMPASAVLVVLGADGSYLVAEALHDLDDRIVGQSPANLMVHAPSIWLSDGLAARLVDRILEATRDVPLAAVGVALIGDGQPAVWQDENPTWCERENYFNQRVRMLLSERGIRNDHIRIGWVEWQTPDVTETLRHLAALGCERIIVAPSTVTTLTTAIAIDLEHAVDMARLAETVSVVTLGPWGSDSAIVEAAIESVGSVISRR